MPKDLRNFIALVFATAVTSALVEALFSCVAIARTVALRVRGTDWILQAHDLLEEPAPDTAERRGDGCQHPGEFRLPLEFQLNFGRTNSLSVVVQVKDMPDVDANPEDALEHLEVDVTEALKHDLSFPY